MIRLILLGLYVAIVAGLLFVNLYNSLVDAPNWGADMPNSLLAARHYFTVANPGHFFRIFSPINQVLALIAVIVCWKFGNVRYLAIGSLVLAVAADLLTFAYFYPRNEIIFTAPIETSMDTIRLAWEQWSAMNWVRSAMCAVNVVLALIILISSSKKLAV
ncbi:MAG TPA: hypothetical protein VK666_04710 [Chryseolinea sp.]|nr:hypothetical protein [Chryseolinea sp.]